MNRKLLRAAGPEALLRKKLTWKLIKSELFSKKNKEEENEDDDDDDDEACQGFDNLEEEASTDEGSEDEEEMKEAMAPSSRRGSQYLF